MEDGLSCGISGDAYLPQSHHTLPEVSSNIYYFIRLEQPRAIA